MDQFFAAPPIFAGDVPTHPEVRVEAHRQPGARPTDRECWSPAYILHVHDGDDLRVRGVCGTQPLNDVFRRDGVLLVPPWSGSRIAWEGIYAFTRVRLEASFVEAAAADLAVRLRPAARTQVYDFGLATAARTMRDALRAQHVPSLLVGSLATVVASAVASLNANRQPRSQAGRLSEKARRRVVALIDDRIEARLTLDDLAAEAGLSRFHFVRRFRETTGKTPHRYVLERRVALARRLLDDQKVPITEVALRCGFSSASHLAAQFRRFTGVSPTAYRSR